MKDQHEKIKGYRDLSQEEIDLMNAIKEHAEKTRILVAEVAKYAASNKPVSIDMDLNPNRWVMIARDNLQLGYMALTRSVAQSQTF